MQLHEKTTCSLFSKRVTTKAILSTQLKVHMSQFCDSEQFFFITGTLIILLKKRIRLLYCKESYQICSCRELISLWPVHLFLSKELQVKLFHHVKQTTNDLKFLLPSLLDWNNVQANKSTSFTIQYQFHVIKYPASLWLSNETSNNLKRSLWIAFRKSRYMKRYLCVITEPI